MHLQSHSHQIRIPEKLRTSLVTTLKVFANSGSAICLGRPSRWDFVFGGKTTKQVLYLFKKIQWLYFSKGAYTDVGIQYEEFPKTVATLSTQANITIQYIPLTSMQHEDLGPNPKTDECGDQLPNHQKGPPFSSNRRKH